MFTLCIDLDRCAPARGIAEGLQQLCRLLPSCRTEERTGAQVEEIVNYPDRKY